MCCLKNHKKRKQTGRRNQNESVERKIESGVALENLRAM